jgi:anti-sigma B factor antagonist
MILSLASRIVSDIVVLALSGKLQFSERALSDKINSLLTEGHRRFIINLSGITHIDAFGLGQLVIAWTLIENKGGDIWFSQPSTRVLRLLHITKLDTIFQIIKAESEILEELPRELSLV